MQTILTELNYYIIKNCSAITFLKRGQIEGAQKNSTSLFLGS